DASARVYLETGIYAVEAKSKGYPVWSRNVQDLRVECAYVPTKRIAKLLTTSMDYDPWYSDGLHALDWKGLGLTSRTFAVKTDDARNRWQLHDLDLPKRCGGRGRRGLYLAELKSKDVEGARTKEEWWQYPYRVLGNVTDLGVLLKAGPSSGLVWV